MISIKRLHGQRFVSFSCVICFNNKYPCISCRQEQSTYEIAYQDGKLGRGKIKDGLNIKHSTIYELGYTHGQKDNM